ncbi:MAG: cobalamin B12-binding domain-containing protein [Burkholderiaceae bacterium]|nr:cobalamin B12-binding domain-containing protein [Burkholderiaceae bacterium]
MGRINGRSPGTRGAERASGAAALADLHCVDSGGSTARLDRLMKTIEGEIIPRLVLAHRGQVTRGHAAAVDGAVSEAQVIDFAALLLDNDQEAPRLFLSDLRDGGVALEHIYLNLFSPAARRLGEMWSADLCDFTAVTLGLWRLQRLLYECSPSFQVDAEPPADGRRILLAPMPGEQHTFGMFMVAEFFRRAGWDVIDGPVVSGAELTDALARNWFEIIGLSLSCDRGLDAMAALVREIRRTSRNSGIGIIVGGAVFSEHPDAVVRVDADVWARDARQALDAAQDLLFTRPQRQRAAGRG